MALVDATAAVLAGVSDAAVAREWHAEGLLTAAGQTWVRLTVKSVLLRPTNAGLIEHGGSWWARSLATPLLILMTLRG